MVKDKTVGASLPTPTAEPTVAPKPEPSPGLTRDQILKSIYQKPIGPRTGRPIIGAGGLKPFRPPPPGTKAPTGRFKFTTHKPLRSSRMEK
jgi:hypothetical protein